MSPPFWTSHSGHHRALCRVPGLKTPSYLSSSHLIPSRLMYYYLTYYDGVDHSLTKVRHSSCVQPQVLKPENEVDSMIPILQRRKTEPCRPGG